MSKDNRGIIWHQRYWPSCHIPTEEIDYKCLLAQVGNTLEDRVCKSVWYQMKYQCSPCWNCVLEYSRLVKPTAEHTAEVLFPYIVYKYVLPIHHWTWHYITIANSWVFHLQLLGTHWPLPEWHIQLFTYIYISCTYYEICIVFFYLIYTVACALLHKCNISTVGGFTMPSLAEFGELNLQ